VGVSTVPDTHRTLTIVFSREELEVLAVEAAERAYPTDDWEQATLVSWEDTSAVVELTLPPTPPTSTPAPPMIHPRTLEAQQLMAEAESLGYSQLKLAKEVSLSACALSSWKIARRIPSPSNLARLREAIVKLRPTSVEPAARQGD